MTEGDIIAHHQQLILIFHLANLSFDQAAFPSKFKHALITPLLKKPGLSKSDPSNFRPISNLNTIGKILERLALARLLPHLSISPSFSPLQSAYRKFHSTETALLKLTNWSLFLYLTSPTCRLTRPLSHQNSNMLSLHPFWRNPSSPNQIFQISGLFPIWTLLAKYWNAWLWLASFLIFPFLPVFHLFSRHIESSILQKQLCSNWLTICLSCLSWTYLSCLSCLCLYLSCLWFIMFIMDLWFVIYVIHVYHGLHWFGKGHNSCCSRYVGCFWHSGPHHTSS